MEMKKILKELIKYVHMPSFCDEEGYCEALDDCAAIDVGECSCYNINHIVRAFNKGIEFQKQKTNSPWISVEDDLPCNHEELLKSPKSYRTKSVIVRFDNNMHGFAYMTKIPNKWEWFNKIKGITHWMPIPELPKE